MLRERIADESWTPSALAVIDGEDAGIEPSLEDLQHSMAQLRAAGDKRAAALVLGRPLRSRLTRDAR